jgi:hypothetical protein
VRPAPERRREVEVVAIAEDHDRRFGVDAEDPGHELRTTAPARPAASRSGDAAVDRAELAVIAEFRRQVEVDEEQAPARELELGCERLAHLPRLPPGPPTPDGRGYPAGGQREDCSVPVGRDGARVARAGSAAIGRAHALAVEQKGNPDVATRLATVAPVLGVDLAPPVARSAGRDDRTDQPVERPRRAHDAVVGRPGIVLISCRATMSGPPRLRRDRRAEGRRTSQPVTDEVLDVERRHGHGVPAAGEGGRPAGAHPQARAATERR